jgi:hypothetical protein
MSNDLSRAGQNSTQLLDELQRSHETAPTLETLEGVAPPTHGERREIPIPHPGERPNAVRADLADAISIPKPSEVETDQEEHTAPAG